MAIKEAKIDDYPKPIFLEQTEKIIEQMKRNICKIQIGNKNGTGFFCKIVNGDKLIPVFMTN